MKVAICYSHQLGLLHQIEGVSTGIPELNFCSPVSGMRFTLVRGRATVYYYAPAGELYSPDTILTRYFFHHQ